MAVEVDTLALGDARHTVTYLNRARERGMTFSPDSRGVAYSSFEGNEHRVMVEPLPATRARWQVSAIPRNFPMWRADGRELYHLSAGKLMAVPVEAAAGNFRSGTAQLLFEMPGSTGFRTPVSDGQRFLVGVPVGGTAAAPPLDVVLNWPSTQRQQE